MIFDKFVYEIADRFLRRRDFLEVPGGQNDAQDVLHVGRGTRLAEAVEFILRHAVRGVPFLDQQALRGESRDLRVGSGRALGGGEFGRSFGLLVLDDAGGVLRTGLIGVDHGQQGGQRGFEDFVAAFDGAFRADLAVAELLHFLNVGDLRDAELFGDLRTDLGGVAVDGLTSAQNEVEIADLLRQAAQREASRQRIGSAERAVGQKHGLVGAAEQGVAENAGGGGEPHRRDDDFRAVTVLQLEGQLKGVQVFGIENSGKRLTVDGSVGLHGVARDILRVRDLLHKNEDCAAHDCSFLGYSTGRQDLIVKE